MIHIDYGLTPENLLFRVARFCTTFCTLHKLFKNININMSPLAHSIAYKMKWNQIKCCQNLWLNISEQAVHMSMQTMQSVCALCMCVRTQRASLWPASTCVCVCVCVYIVFLYCASAGSCRTNSHGSWINLYMSSIGMPTAIWREWYSLFNSTWELVLHTLHFI